MRYLISALFLLAALSASVFAASQPGKTNRPAAEYQPNAQSSSTMPVDRDCAGNGKPKGMQVSIVAVASGAGSVTTITETDTVNTWVSTVDTHIANTTTVSCSQLQ